MPCTLSKNIETGVVAWLDVFRGFGRDLWFNDVEDNRFCRGLMAGVGSV